MLAVSCGASTKSENAGSPSADSRLSENSGKYLSGDFEVNAIEDEYSSKGTLSRQGLVFSFDERGNFKRQDRSRREEGSYVIDMRGELGVYIEKVNGEPLAAAQMELYRIIEERDNGLTLQSGPSRRLVLRKR